MYNGKARRTSKGYLLAEDIKGDEAIERLLELYPILLNQIRKMMLRKIMS
jgi:hypothetical protein